MWWVHNHRPCGESTTTGHGVSPQPQAMGWVHNHRPWDKSTTTGDGLSPQLNLDWIICTIEIWGERGKYAIFVPMNSLIEFFCLYFSHKLLNKSVSPRLHKTTNISVHDGSTATQDAIVERAKHVSSLQIRSSTGHASVCLFVCLLFGIHVSQFTASFPMEP